MKVLVYQLHFCLSTWNGNLFTYIFNVWSRGLHEKLTGPQLLRKFPAFYKTREVSSPRLQKPATSPYPESDQSSPRSPSHFSKINFNIILPSKPVPSFPHVSPPEPFMHISCPKW